MQLVRSFVGALVLALVLGSLARAEAEAVPLIAWRVQAEGVDAVLLGGLSAHAPEQYPAVLDDAFKSASVLIVAADTSRPAAEVMELVRNQGYYAAGGGRMGSEAGTRSTSGLPRRVFQPRPLKGRSPGSRR